MSLSIRHGFDQRTIINLNLMLVLVVFFDFSYWSGVALGSSSEDRWTRIRIHPLEMSTTLHHFEQVNSRDGREQEFAREAKVSQEDGAPLTGQSIPLQRRERLHVKMFNDRQFRNERYIFDASEKVYLVMQFQNLMPGERAIQVLWQDPNGKLVNTAQHIIVSKEDTTKHRTFFWLKFLKHGMFREMFTGKEYRGEVHGRWNAEIYVDNDHVATQDFDVLN